MFLLFLLLMATYLLPSCLLHFPDHVPPCFVLTLLASLCVSFTHGTECSCFIRSSGHKAKERPGQLSVYKALCHVNKDKQSLFLCSHLPNSTTFSIESKVLSLHPYLPLCLFISDYISSKLMAS